jgi:hypothetical protein
VDDAALVRVRAGAVDLTLAKRADGQWWRAIVDVAVSPDGTVAVLEEPERDGGIRLHPGRAVIARFDRDGQPLSQHELPEGVHAARIAHAGRWVLVHRFGSDPWLIDVRDGHPWRVELADLEPDQQVELGLSPAGDALWVLEIAHRRLRTYSLPE